jgi:hypothetical protein
VLSPRNFSLPVLLLVLPGCLLGELGQLGARTTGDLTFVSGERGRPDEAMLFACGDGTPTPLGVERLLRLPYLQRVTDESAAVLWVSRGPPSSQLVLTRPDGRTLATRPAVADSGAHPLEGEQRLAEPGGLEPDTLYCYQLLEEGQPLTARAGFRTAPARGAPTPFSFVAFGDSGSGGSDQYAVLSQLEEVPFSLALGLGDLAYDSGTLEQLEENVFRVYAGLFRSIPFYPTTGNHDYRTDDARPFREVFSLPENGGEAGLERWYSFDHGSVHFVALDTERRREEQVAWLDRDLAASDLPWKVVYLHKPPYSSGVHGSSEDVRADFAPVLERHGVQLVLAGHDHHYERTVAQNGVTYVVSGGGGARIRSVGHSPFTAFAESVLHFVRVTVTPEALTLQAVDAAGQEFDSARILRGAAR